MEKRHNSMLIPYCFKEGNLYVFLQRRTADAPRNPNILGGFGGGFEGKENNDEALLRVEINAGRILIYSKKILPSWNF
jgi:hypothetical protein